MNLASLRLISVSATSSVALAFLPLVHATNGIWTNSSGGTWSASGNWNGGTIADGADATADFSSLDIAADQTVTLDTNRTVGSLTFGDTSGTSAWTLGGASALTLATGSGSPTITTNTNVTLHAALQGTQGFTKQGSGSLKLSGGASNTISGSILVNAGSLAIDDTNSIKNTTASITVASGATLDFWGAYQSGAMTNALTIGGTGINGEGAFTISGNGYYNGTITLSSDAKIAHSANAGTIDGTITGSGQNLDLAAAYGGQPDFIIGASIQTGTGGVTIHASGTQQVQLNGINTYTGATTVSTGHLMVNGSITSAVTVNSGALFGGTGSSTRSLHINSGGTLTGGASGAVGTFTTTNTVTFDSGSTYAVDFNSGTAKFDQIIASGFSLGSVTLSLADLGSTTLGLGQTFTIMDGTGTSITGTFTGLSEGSFITVGSNVFQISYLADSGKDVTLTTVASAVPEPATWAMLGGIAALTVTTLHRRRGSRC